MTGTQNGDIRKPMTFARKKENSRIWIERKRMVLQCWKVESTKDEIAYEHPAIFPDDLLAHDHIISWSNEGQTVLDPLWGRNYWQTKTKLLGRNFIGIEKEETYFEIAKRELKCKRINFNSSVISLQNLFGHTPKLFYTLHQDVFPTP